MPELIAGITQLSGLIEKGGIIAVLIVVIGFSFAEIRRMRILVAVTFSERDKARALAGRYKYALEASNPAIKVDISDILMQFEGIK